ncbi:Transcriptional activator ARO80 [Cladobotryum mycophilum]|uniref:Transcriptional activator ARO80 n=1 Tax=Cladobotryum mycophilum TaxID=491253 RepID=A0ABR0SBK4_9HYPO
MEQLVPSDAATVKIPKRAYQACIRCRQRKARCLILDPTQGTDPSCLRCKRERKECVFTAERSRKQPSRDASQQQQHGPSRSSHDSSSTHSSRVDTGPSGSPLWSQLERPDARRDVSVGQVPAGPSGELGQRQQQESPVGGLTDRVTRTVVTNQSEALNLLFEAAEVYHASDSSSRPIVNDAGSLNVDFDGSVQTPSFNSARHSKGWEWAYPAENMYRPSEDVIQIFGRLKFVKKRWLTAQEAATFVQLFFKNMSPLTPIISDWYGNPANFRNLVDHEPVLCTAILTLSSRYHLLHGDGWLSRSYFLHNRLWRFCQSLLQRVIWGQEKSVVSSARSLGTVEGLLLMAEWHARSLHLPPDIEAWDSEDDALKDDEKGQSDSKMISFYHYHSPIFNSSSAIHRWLEGVVEPMRRSDRMSWSLIQSAASLGQELELFNEDKDSAIDAGKDATHTFTAQRKQRLRIVLYIYINQLAFRIGFSSLIPHNLINISPNAIRKSSDSKLSDHLLDYMSLCVDLTRLTRASHDLLFASKTTTRDMVSGGGYRRILEHFKPMLESWWSNYSQMKDGGPMREFIAIDFLYTKIYLYSLAVQAAAERKMSHQSSSDALESIFPSIFDFYNEDFTFIQELVDAAKEVLRLIVGFAETGRLRFLPALALGVPIEELNASLGLIDQGAKAMRLHIVDDLHLAGIFASLLEMYTEDFRARFVSINRVSRPAGSGVPDGEHFSSTTQTIDGAVNDMAAMDVVNDYGMNQEWLAHPFDASIAPFGAGFTQTFGVFDDELNFIWNQTL